MSTPGHIGRRLVQLYVGLTLYGVSSALLVASDLGLEPWGVLHQGLARRTGLSIGEVSIVVGAAVLLLAADTAARVLLPTGEMPVAIVTAFLGGPMLIWTVRRYGAGAL